MTVEKPVLGPHPLGVHLREAMMMLKPASILMLEVFRKFLPRF
jgi:hypothetical protein